MHFQATLCDYFYNAEQQANQAYEKGDYVAAGHDFQDPYKGSLTIAQGDYKLLRRCFANRNVAKSPPALLII